MSSKIVWIVDWDLPTDPHRARVAFYRALKKLRAKYHLENHMSTQSVMIVPNEEAARAIHQLALSYGRSHLYRAIEEGVHAPRQQREPIEFKVKEK